MGRKKPSFIRHEVSIGVLLSVYIPYAETHLEQNQGHAQADVEVMSMALFGLQKGKCQEQEDIGAQPD